MNLTSSFNNAQCPLDTTSIQTAAPLCRFAIAYPRIPATGEGCPGQLSSFADPDIMFILRRGCAHLPTGDSVYLRFRYIAADYPRHTSSSCHKSEQSLSLMEELGNTSGLKPAGLPGSM